MNRYLSRKSFVSTLGAAGLGLGLTAGTLGTAPSAMAQDEDEVAADEAATQDGPAGEIEDFREKRVEIYNAFTAALAQELNIDSADEVDGAIRIAIMAVIDDHVGEDDGLTAGQAEALKTLVATSDVPFPAMAFGGGHDMVFARMHGGPGFGMEGMHGGFGHGAERGRIIAKHRAMAGEDGAWITVRDDEGRADEGDDARADDSDSEENESS